MGAGPTPVRCQTWTRERDRDEESESKACCYSSSCSPAASSLLTLFFPRFSLRPPVFVLSVTNLTFFFNQFSLALFHFFLIASKSSDYGRPVAPMPPKPPLHIYISIGAYSFCKGQTRPLSVLTDTARITWDVEGFYFQNKSIANHSIINMFF